MAVDGEAVRASVRRKYGEVAERPGGHFPYPVGRASALGLGYSEVALARIPEAVIDRFVGVGNPLGLRPIEIGDAILDVGCGCGLDTAVAALESGPTGRVVGLDLSREMIAAAERAFASVGPGGSGREGSRQGDTPRPEFVHGDAETLPFPEATFDRVISNGALNLVPDKERAFREIHRVLVDGGYLTVVDLLVIDSVPAELLESMEAWST